MQVLLEFLSLPFVMKLHEIESDNLIISACESRV